jgi:hypothetical protein
VEDVKIAGRIVIEIERAGCIVIEIERAGCIVIEIDAAVSRVVARLSSAQCQHAPPALASGAWWVVRVL